MTSPPPRVVAIQFDGLRADSLNEEATPNILAAAAQGTWFQNHRSTFPTSTRVCVSSLATGAHPEAHGLPGNSLFSPHLGRAITTGSHEDLIAWHRARGEPLLLRDTFLRRGDAIVSVASSGSAWLWNAARRARLVHPDLPEVDALAKSAPPADKPDLARCAWALEVALGEVIPRHSPRALVIHLSEPDSAQHQHGAAGAEQLRALKGVDRLFGAFWEGLARACGDLSRTTLILFSDHGVVATAGSVDIERELSAVAGRGESWEVAHSEGAALFCAESDEALNDLAAFLRTKEWAGPLFSKGGPKGGPKGGEDAEGGVPGTMPLELAGCGGGRAPDLLMGFQWGDGLFPGKDPPGESREGALPGWGYSSVNNVGGGGTHGSSSPYELRNFLIAAGPDFPAGKRVDAPTGNIDLAPTILALTRRKGRADMTGAALTRARRARGKERVFRLEGRDFLQTLSRTEAGGRFYLNFARVER